MSGPYLAVMLRVVVVVVVHVDNFVVDAVVDGRRCTLSGSLVIELRLVLLLIVMEWFHGCASWLVFSSFMDSGIVLVLLETAHWTHTSRRRTHSQVKVSNLKMGPPRHGLLMRLLNSFLFSLLTGSRWSACPYSMQSCRKYQYFLLFYGRVLLLY